MTREELEDRTRRAAAAAARRRAHRNGEIAELVRAGVYVEPPIDAEESFFPRRPAPRKDADALRLIFSGEDT